MCGRYVLDPATPAFQARFNLDEIVSGTFDPNWNGAPTQHTPVIINRDGKHHPGLMQWGLVPPWAKDPKIGQKMINAREETVMEKTSFKRPLQSRRALIPATGFYEWKKDGARKTPYFIHLKDEELFAFAGLYERWHAPDGGVLQTYAIITTDANEVTAPIHNRMPVILPRDAEDVWLQEGPLDPPEIEQLLRPYPAKQMEAYPVSTNVNRPGANDPSLREQAVNSR
jgi:putative SOS response-associated peptidase YedK